MFNISGDVGLHYSSVSHRKDQRSVEGVACQLKTLIKNISLPSSPTNKSSPNNDVGKPSPSSLATDNNGKTCSLATECGKTASLATDNGKTTRVADTAKTSPADSIASKPSLATRSMVTVNQIASSSLADNAKIQLSNSSKSEKALSKVSIN